MTDKEALIATTAIDRRQATTFEKIQKEVSNISGISIEEVSQAIDSLCEQDILKRCTTPAHNVLEALIDPGEITWAWYEKGDLWPGITATIYPA